MRILILDDDRSYGALLASASKKLGHRAIVKVDAQEAVQILRNQEADIALVDLEMPTGSGTAFAKTLRQNGITVPIAFCTGTCRDLQLIEEAESMGQVLPKIWTHADLRVILSALQLESNSLNRIREEEAENNESTDQDERYGSLADGSNDHYRRGRYRPASPESSQEISRTGGSRPGEYRPSSREMARPSSREISRGGSREDLRLPHQMRPPSSDVPAPLGPPAPLPPPETLRAPEPIVPPASYTPAVEPAAPSPRPGGKYAGQLSAAERSRAEAPTAAPPIDGLPPPLLDPDPEELVDAIPPPSNMPLELADVPPLELADVPSRRVDSGSQSLLPPDLFDPVSDEEELAIDIEVPDVPTTDRPRNLAGASGEHAGVEPLTPPNPFQVSTTNPGSDPAPPKKRLETMLEVGEALRETPRVNIGCSNWDQVRRLCGDVMRGMSTITVRARCEMRAGEDVMVALELPDEMVVSIGARVLDFRERSADGKRPYQLDLVGFGNDEITYLLGSCDANSVDSQETQRPAQAAPTPAAAAPMPAPMPAPIPAPLNPRAGSAAPMQDAAVKTPPSLAAEAEEAETGDKQMPSIPDAIDALDAEVSYEDRGPSISWS